jgi:integrase
LQNKTLSRLLYETAARASEVLALDIEDLDLAKGGPAVIAKGRRLQGDPWRAQRTCRVRCCTAGQSSPVLLARVGCGRGSQYLLT